MSRRSDLGSRLEPLAIAWGAMLPWIALVALAAQPSAVRLAVGTVAFAAGGYLAGVRASGARPLHGALAGPAAFLLYAAFAVLTDVAHRLGAAADPLSVAPSGGRDLLIALLVGTVVAAAGAHLAALRLRRGGSARLGV